MAETSGGFGAAETTSAQARPAQRFTVSHLREEDFKSDGLRAYAKYRDLGIAKATNGMVQAHVIRFVPPCRPEEVAKLHYHDVDFQMVYVLKGWIKSEFEGQGAITMHVGSSWIQPPGIRHRVLDYSDDCEVLEIILPADFDTVMLE
jgi:mannose-6-phosphate isomerase-like protein (cupin superfamily)